MQKNQSQNSDVLKFDHLELQNFKNIEKYVIEIGGKSFLIFGKNGAGKSSLIQALTSPLDSKVLPSKTIKKGEDKAMVEITLSGQIGGVPKKYILTMYFTPGKQSGRLVVTNEKGEEQKMPSTFVKSLIGNVSFGITDWVTDTKAGKLKMLKALSKCEDVLAAIDEQIKAKKAEIKAKGDHADEMEAAVKHHGYTSEQIDLYSTKQNVEELQTNASLALQALTQYNDIETKTKTTFPEDIKKTEALIDAGNKEKERLNAEIARLQGLLKLEDQKIEVHNETIAKKKENIRKGEAWLLEVQKPDVDACNKRVNDAISHNQHCDTIAAFAQKQREMLAAKDEVLKLKGEVTSLDKQYADTIEKSQLPIKGLRFTDNEIFIDDLPLEEGQQNTALLMDIGIEIAIALNPVLKVIFINEASLFDIPTLKAVFKKIEDRGYMGIGEYVDPQGGELAIKFTETLLAN